MRTAKHLPFQHFETVNMPFDWAGTPGQGDARFDRGIVLAESLGEMLQGLQRTRARPRQPWIQVRGLPLAHHLRKVLGEIDGLGDRGRLRVELGELLGLGRCALRGTS